MQIKTTVSDELTEVRMVIINKSISNECCRGLKCTMLQPLWRTVWKFIFLKLGIKLLCVCTYSLSCGWHFVTLWTVALQAPLSMGFFQARILEQIFISSSKGFFQHRDWIHVSWVSCITRRFFATEPSKKLNPPYDPATPLLGIFHEKTIIEKDMYPSVLCSTTYNCQDMEAT